MVLHEDIQYISIMMDSFRNLLDTSSHFRICPMAIINLPRIINSTQKIENCCRVNISQLTFDFRTGSVGIEIVRNSFLESFLCSL